MKCSLRFSFILVLLLPIFLSAQTVTGKLVDQNGTGLSGLQLQLYINPKVYNTTSGSDGTFTFTNVSEVKDNRLPTGYEVSTNYPNPFNPRTRMNISLPNTGKVRIELFNIIGQKVKNVINSNLSAGNNYIDLELNGLPNGFYIARVTIDEKYTVTKKLMLLYGSQHLSASVPNIQLNKSASGVKSTQDLIIDSLVVTGSLIGKKVFVGLPHLTGNFLDLGKLTVTTAITITSLDKSSADPGSFLTITGLGFDNTASLSVRFFDGGKYTMAIPVRNASTTTINITVPPFINMTTGGFEPGVVNVQVIQKSGTVTFTSNTISGFQINALPTLTLPPGSVISNMAGFLELTLTDVQNRLSHLDTSSTGQINTVDLRSKLESLRILFGQLKTKIRESMNNPSQAETVGTINGISVSLTQANLQIADQWMVAVINGILAKMQEAPSISKQSKRLMNSHSQSTERIVSEYGEEYLITMTHTANSEGVSQQQYNQLDVLPAFRDKLHELGDMVGAGTATIGGAFVLAGVSLPVMVLAVLAAPSIIISSTIMDVDATSLYLNPNNIPAAKRLEEDFRDLIKSEKDGVESSIIGAKWEKGGVCFDLYNGFEPYEDKLLAFIDQSETYLAGLLPSGDTYTGRFNYKSDIFKSLECGGAEWNANISAIITITVSGSGTVNDPYSGKMIMDALGVLTLYECDCSGGGGCGSGDPETFSDTGLVYGIEGTVAAFIANSRSFSGDILGIGWATFINGTFNGNTLTGNLQFGCETINWFSEDITLTKVFKK
jgi:Secretion system C-terminal sorting domain